MVSKILSTISSKLGVVLGRACGHTPRKHGDILVPGISERNHIGRQLAGLNSCHASQIPPRQSGRCRGRPN